MSELIKTNNLSRHFEVGGKTIKALQNVNINIEKGEFTFFQGPSGSGKTTMMNILGALDDPTGGDVFFGGEVINGWNDEKKNALRRDKMGFIFQSIALISMMSAYENVDFGLRIARIPAEERNKRVVECLDRVGLKKRMHHFPQELSGGEQQRVAIARAIAHGPEVILADEPTSDLDSKTTLQVIKLFKDLIDDLGISIIMTSHNPSIIDLGDRIFTFNDGKVIKEK